MNSVNIIGRLGRDPEVKYTTGNKAVCSFSVAIDDGTKERPHCSWIECTAWEKTAALIGEYCLKGQQIALSGKLRQDSWESDGQKRSKVLVVVDRITFLAKPQNPNQQHSDDQTPAAYSGEESQGGGETPF